MGPAQLLVVLCSFAALCTAVRYESPAAGGQMLYEPGSPYTPGVFGKLLQPQAPQPFLHGLRLCAHAEHHAGRLALGLFACPVGTVVQGRR